MQWVAVQVNGSGVEGLNIAGPFDSAESIGQWLDARNPGGAKMNWLPVPLHLPSET